MAGRPAYRIAGLLWWVGIGVGNSTIAAQPSINPVLLKEEWPAQWVSHPTAPLREYGVFHFRRTFDLPSKPEQFIIHVSAYERHIDTTGMLGPMDHWNFVDWAEQWTDDIPPGARDGNSSVITMCLILALQQAADLIQDRPDEVARYRTLADSLRKAVLRHCWDDGRGLPADTPAKRDFSQHAGILAVLADLVPQDRRKTLLETVLARPELTQCSCYFRSYLFSAMKKAGLGDRFVETLAPWRDMMKLGLTTFSERPEPSRSDCHAWSAAPVYEFLATVCGIEPAGPAFQPVRIRPFLGPLTQVVGRMPHPLGEISVRYRRTGRTGLEAEITLPQGLSSDFIWNETTAPLTGGPRKLSIP